MVVRRRVVGAAALRRLLFAPSRLQPWRRCGAAAQAHSAIGHRHLHTTSHALIHAPLVTSCRSRATRTTAPMAAAATTTSRRCTSYKAADATAAAHATAAVSVGSEDATLSDVSHDTNKSRVRRSTRKQKTATTTATAVTPSSGAASPSTTTPVTPPTRRSRQRSPRISCNDTATATTASAHAAEANMTATHDAASDDKSSSISTSSTTTATTAAAATLAAADAKAEAVTTTTTEATAAADETVAADTTASLLSDDDVDEFMRALHDEAQARELRMRRERERLLQKPHDTTATASPSSSDATTTTATATTTSEDSDVARRTAGVEAEALTAEQQLAIDLVMRGRNVFITGGAGTGKSLVLRELTLRLREQAVSSSSSAAEDGGGGGKEQRRRQRRHGNGSTVYVTATTGVAALNVRGATVNSFAGLGYAEGDADEVLARVRRSRRACGRLRYCSTLILDEVSMATPRLFDTLDYVARHIRKQPTRAFGGMQVVVCGDFLQLPPIVRGGGSGGGNSGGGGGWPGVRRCAPYTMHTATPAAEEAGGVQGQAQQPPCNDDNDNGGGTAAAEQSQSLQYCFQTRAWRELDLCVVLLQQKHRQGNDAAFQRVLDDVRVGKLSLQSYKLLASRAVTSAAAAAATPTATTTTAAAAADDGGASEAASRIYVRLCGTNKEVDARNSKHFALLPPQTVPQDGTQRTRTVTSTAAAAAAVTVNARGDYDGTDAATDYDGDDDPLLPLHVYTSYDVVYDVASNGKGANSNHGGGSGGGSNGTQHSSHALSRGDVFDKRGGGGGDARNATVRFEDSNLQTSLPLKVGTRVMLLHNVSTRLGVVNGSVGTVCGFLHPLELVELLLRVAAQRRNRATTATATARTQALMRRGGFDTVKDVYRCVDTWYGQSLYWWLRSEQRGVQDVAQLSYEDVYGAEHLRHVQRLVGLDEVASVDGDTLSSLQARAHGATASAPGNDDDSGGGDEDNAGDDDSGAVSLLDDLAASSGLRATRNRSDDGSGRTSNVPRSHIAAVGARVQLHNILPLHVRLTRLPIVRIHLQPPPTLSHDPSLLLSSSATHEAQQARVSRWPTHVHAFVSPVEQRWYMGSEVIAQRTQLPLRHAWAMTVHKSQGLTIAQLEVDMRRFTTPGQTYVALSRATTLDSLRLLNFAPECIRACPVACAYYAELQHRLAVEAAQANKA